MNELNVHDGLLLGLDDSWGEAVEVNGDQNDVSVLVDLDASRVLEVVLGRTEQSATEPWKSLLNLRLKQIKAGSLHLWDLPEYLWGNCQIIELAGARMTPKPLWAMVMARQFPLTLRAVRLR